MRHVSRNACTYFSDTRHTIARHGVRYCIIPSADIFIVRVTTKKNLFIPRTKIITDKATTVMTNDTVWFSNTKCVEYTHISVSKNRVDKDSLSHTCRCHRITTTVFRPLHEYINIYTLWLAKLQNASIVSEPYRLLYLFRETLAATTVKITPRQRARTSLTSPPSSSRQRAVWGRRRLQILY